MRSTFRLLAAGCAAVVLGAGCDHAVLPTPSNFSAIPVTESFTGTLQPAGDAFYSFSMASAGNVSLTLISVTGPSVPTDAAFPIGIGIPVGVGCTASVDAAAKPGGAPQYTVARNSGVYCVRIADNNLIGAPAAFVLNITHPR